MNKLLLRVYFKFFDTKYNIEWRELCHTVKYNIKIIQIGNSSGIYELPFIK